MGESLPPEDDPNDPGTGGGGGAPGAPPPPGGIPPEWEKLISILRQAFSAPGRARGAPGGGLWGVDTSGGIGRPIPTDRTDLERAYKLGLIAPEKFVASYQDPQTGEMIKRMLDKEVAAGKAINLTDIRELRQKGLIDDAKVKGLLNESGITEPEHQDYLVKLFGDHTKATSLGEIQSFVQGGVLSAQAGAQRLKDAGLIAPEDAELYQQLWEKGLQKPKGGGGASAAATAAQTRADALAHPDLRGANPAQLDKLGLAGPGADPGAGGKVSTAHVQSAASLQTNFTQQFQDHIGGLFHSGAIDPITAHWALGNQDHFFMQHLAGGGVGNMPDANSINLVKQGMEFAPREKISLGGTGTTPVSANPETL